MIAFAIVPQVQPCDSSMEGHIELQTNSDTTIYKYRIAIVDVDPKPVSKMQYYYDLDQQIVQHYLLAGQQQTQKAE